VTKSICRPCLFRLNHQARAKEEKEERATVVETPDTFSSPLETLTASSLMACVSVHLKVTFHPVPVARDPRAAALNAVQVSAARDLRAPAVARARGRAPTVPLKVKASAARALRAAAAVSVARDPRAVAAWSMTTASCGCPDPVTFPVLEARDRRVPVPTVAKARARAPPVPVKVVARVRARAPPMPVKVVARVRARAPPVPVKVLARVRARAPPVPVKVLARVRARAPPVPVKVLARVRARAPAVPPTVLYQVKKFTATEVTTTAAASCPRLAVRRKATTTTTAAGLHLHCAVEAFHLAGCNPRKAGALAQPVNLQLEVKAARAARAVLVPVLRWNRYALFVDAKKNSQRNQSRADVRILALHRHRSFPVQHRPRSFPVQHRPRTFPVQHRPRSFPVQHRPRKLLLSQPLSRLWSILRLIPRRCLPP
jgi:hypothetical protein